MFTIETKKEKESLKDKILSLGLEDNNTISTKLLCLNDIEKVILELGYEEPEEGVETNGWQIDWSITYEGSESNITVSGCVVYDSSISIKLEGK